MDWHREQKRLARIKMKQDVKRDLKRRSDALAKANGRKHVSQVGRLPRLAAAPKSKVLGAGAQSAELLGTTSQAGRG